MKYVTRILVFIETLGTISKSLTRRSKSTQPIVLMKSVRIMRKVLQLSDDFHRNIMAEGKTVKS